MNSKYSKKKLYKTLKLGIGLTIVSTIFGLLSNDIRAQEALQPHDRGVLNEYVRALKQTETEEEFAKITTQAIDHIQESMKSLINQHKFEQAIRFMKDYRQIAEKESFPDMAHACDELLAQAEEGYELQKQQMEDFKKADMHGLYEILKYFHNTGSWKAVPQDSKQTIDTLVMERLVEQAKIMRKQGRHIELKAILIKLKEILINLSSDDYSFRHSKRACEDILIDLNILMNIH